MQRLILFAKRPRLGRVKTRLVPPLSADQALTLYRAMLFDQIAFLGRFGRDRVIELCLDGPPAEEDLPRTLPRGLGITEQGPGDLGQRMLAAFRRSRDEGSTETAILGADCPTLPVARVERAFRLLRRGAGAAVVPASDGGYVLIGLTAPRERLFQDLPWGGADVFAETLRRAREERIRLETLDGWYDVDDVASLRRLGDETTRIIASERAPRTANALARLASDSPGVV